ncbi:MAG: DUF2179 domain-containing protein [Candidatus Thermoplasmatota archaeon]|nr:DUF2179 domain-containing protein [Candidatus Thermoplasmatota archaeon]
MDFFDTEIFTWVVIPILICFARIIDVTIGTLRIIFISKGMKYLAPVMGFFEVIIWLVAIGQIMQNLSNVVNYIAYGTGFAIGNYVGIMIENKISLGYVLVRIITRRSATNLIEWLEKSGRKFTIVDARSDWGLVNIIYMPLKRKEVREVVSKVKAFNPNAFYTIEDVRSVSGSTFKDENLPPTKKNVWKGVVPMMKRK